MHLASIEKRLNNPKLNKIEKSQREAFSNIVKSFNFRNNAEALSISCGDGIWDYLLYKNNKFFTKIMATDIVPCPVSKVDQELLRNQGQWEFTKVEPSGLLPFENERYDFIFHQDVIEHTEKPFQFLREQYRVLKNEGFILVGTPNLFRPANIVKILLGKLKFPVKIGYHEEIGDYIHIQEFYEQQLTILLQEIGFRNIKVLHCFWGLSFSNICFSMHPKGSFGKLMCHYLTFYAEK